MGLLFIGVYKWKPKNQLNSWWWHNGRRRPASLPGEVKWKPATNPLWQHNFLSMSEAAASATHKNYDFVLFSAPSKWDEHHQTQLGRSVMWMRISGAVVLLCVSMINCNKSPCIFYLNCILVHLSHIIKNHSLFLILILHFYINRFIIITITMHFSLHSVIILLASSQAHAFQCFDDNQLKIAVNKYVEGQCFKKVLLRSKK